jgi:hypothetical protein
MVRLFRKKCLVLMVMLQLLNFAGCSATQTSTRTKTDPPELTWEEVLQSNDINRYKEFLHENPNTEHYDELVSLINHFLVDKVYQLKEEGKDIIIGSDTIPFNLNGNGAVWTIGAGSMSFGSVDWYSDPINHLRVRWERDGFKVLGGRGIGIRGNQAYLFGF